MAITCGSDGCHWLTRDDQGKVPGVRGRRRRRDRARATPSWPGCIAGLIAEPEIPTEPQRIEAICRFANAAGALTATGRGAIPSLPTREAVEALVRSGLQ